MVRLFILLLLCTNVLLGYGLYNYRNELFRLQGEYNAVAGELSMYKPLALNYPELEKEYDTLQQEYNKIQAEYRDLRERYNLLEVEYEVTREQLNVEELLRIGQGQQDYYNEIRIHSGMKSKIGALLKFILGYLDQSFVNFAVYLAQHDLGVPLPFPTIAESYYNAEIVEKFHKNEGYYMSSTAKEKLDDVLTYIGAGSQDTNEEKIRKILDFTDKHIHYEYDMNEIYRAPFETLGLKSGDCDDYSIMTAALFTDAGIKSAIGFFHSKDEYHVMVLVQGLYNGGCRNYDDLTSKGLSSGRWTLIEPQYTFEQQSWAYCEDWQLEVASEV